jgi:histidinol-phosphate/aromatic aminotransferase/cobyric acid decarboxylase-like protein
VKFKLGDFRCSVNPLGPSAKGKNLVRKKLRLLGDPSDEGLRRLQAYVAAREGVETDNIRFGHDREQSMRSLAGLVLPSSAVCLWPSPWWLKSLFLNLSIPLRETAAVRGSFDVAAKDLLAAAGSADMMVLPRPHEVTGATLPDHLLDAAVRLMADRGKLVVVDDSFREFKGSASLGPVAMQPGCAVLKSFSPFFSLSMFRLSYIISSREVIAALSKVTAEDEISPLACWAALGSMKDRGFIRRTGCYYEEEKRFMTSSLNRLRGIVAMDGGADAVLVSVVGEEANVREALGTKGVLLECFTDGSGQVFLKLPVGKHVTNAGLVRVIRKVVAGVHGR